MIQPERIRPLNGVKVRRGDFVAYWMQAAQRAECNHALEYAVRRANDLDRPLVVFLGLTRDFPEANERHYAFLLEGLKETETALRRRGIRLTVGTGSPVEGIVRLGRRASLVVTDDGYLRIEREWRAGAAARLACPFVEVATNVVVPPATASPKEEYSAATLRPKLFRHLARFLVPLRETELRRDAFGLSIDFPELGGVDERLAGLRPDRRAGRIPACRGGASAARRLLKDFIARKLAGYAEARSDPAADATSRLSPYLHFGQISPLQVALEAGKAPPYGRAPFLEELIVRRELAVNFVFYNRAYDRFEGLPAWSRATLLEHSGDRREFVYSIADFEGARTHDPYWNAAQTEMVLTGRMHGHMRMYWGKKILEWSLSPRRAFRTALTLNNRYELDGRDANGFAGVAWCFGKHDRPWPGRPVFGTVRAMNAGGLRRKFDIDAYVRRIDALAAADAGQIDKPRELG